MLRLRIFPRAVPGVAPTEQSAENGQTRRMTCHIQIALMRYIMIHEIPYKYRPNFCAALRPGYTSRRNQSRSASCFILLHVSGNHLSLFSFEIKFAYTEKHISLCFDKCKHSVTSIFTEKKKLKKSQPLSLSKDIQVN